MREDNSRRYKLYAECIPSGECSQCPIGGRSLVYGPFRSRRRGLSIGINLFPLAKVCSFNCIYCFRGPTEILTINPTDDGANVTASILVKALETSIEEISRSHGTVDAIDFSGRGEPTLHPRFGEFLKTVKAFLKNRGLDVSLGVFTNSSTLHRESIVDALKEVDYVEAKLDTVFQHKFRVLNMPHEALSIDKIIRGLKDFRKKFDEVLVIQTMLLNYRSMSNSNLEDAEALAEKLVEIEPDEVHLYTVYRIPRIKDVRKVERESMENFAKVLKRHGLKVKAYPK